MQLCTRLLVLLVLRRALLLVSYRALVLLSYSFASFVEAGVHKESIVHLHLVYLCKNPSKLQTTTTNREEWTHL